MKWHDIEMACKELRSSSSPGPDGVPAALLKTASKELSKPLFLLWRASLDQGVIPADLLLVLISPVHKGGSRGVPANYRPVALTSHLTKVFERWSEGGLLHTWKKMVFCQKDSMGSGKEDLA